MENIYVYLHNEDIYIYIFQVENENSSKIQSISMLGMQYSEMVAF